MNLTRFDEWYLSRLVGLRNYYARRGELREDGSFFQSAKKLCWWLKCTEVGLMKSRKRLLAAGKIRYNHGTGRGKASHYWILDGSEKPQKPQDPEGYVRPPLGLERVKELTRSLGKTAALQMLKNEGYLDIEIEACL